MWSARHLLCLSVLLWSGAVTAASPLEAFDEIVALMQRHYFDASYGGLNWAAITRSTRAGVAAAPSAETQYRLIADMLAQLKYSHLVFVPPRPYAEYLGVRGYEPPPFAKGPARVPGFRLNVVEGRLAAVAVEPDSPAWTAGLRPGFIVESINDWPVRGVLSSRTAALEVMEALERFPTATLRLAGRDARDRVLALSFRLPSYRGAEQVFGAMRGRETFAERVFDDGVVLLRLGMFSFPTVKRVKAALQRHRQAPGLILDVRDNPGGVGLLAVAVASALTDQPFSLGSQTGRDMNLKYPVLASPGAYLGPLCVVVNRGSLSTAEMLARGLQVTGRAAIVGEKTPGIALPSLIVRLCDGSMFQYPVGDFRDTDGGLLEGVGVTPDAVAVPTVAGVRAGHDELLERALAVVREKGGR